MFAIATLLGSCEKENASDVNQDKIYTDYEMFYDKNSDVTKVLARFRFGGPTGTILEIDGNAVVMFNQDTLPYNGWYTGHYKEYAGRISSAAFTYKNLDGNTFVNNVPTCDTIAFSPSFTTLQKSNAQTITWVGSSVAANQMVGIYIGTWAWDQDALALQTGVGATNIVLGTDKMSGLTNGSGTAFMERTTETNVSQGTSEGGKIRHKYKALNQQINIVD